MVTFEFIDTYEFDSKLISFNKNDILVGITASGSAKFVLGALAYAKTLNVHTVLIT